jgi:hypothetical protein
MDIGIIVQLECGSHMKIILAYFTSESVEIFTHFRFAGSWQSQ